MLLVLDNFEHLAAAASEVGRLLAACPTVKLLVTSREPLHLRWEQEYPLPPLGVPELEQARTPGELAAVPAVTLFVARARAAHPEFQL